MTAIIFCVLPAMQKDFDVDENSQNASVIQRIQKNQVWQHLKFL